MSKGNSDIAPFPNSDALSHKDFADAIDEDLFSPEDLASLGQSLTTIWLQQPTQCNAHPNPNPNPVVQRVPGAPHNPYGWSPAAIEAVNTFVCNPDVEHTDVSNDKWETLHQVLGELQFKGLDELRNKQMYAFSKVIGYVTAQTQVDGTTITYTFKHKNQQLARCDLRGCRKGFALRALCKHFETEKFPSAKDRAEHAFDMIQKNQCVGDVVAFCQDRNANVPASENATVEADA